jgi:ribosomal-protein-alanine N-acetyltransferase
MWTERLRLKVLDGGSAPSVLGFMLKNYDFFSYTIPLPAKDSINLEHILNSFWLEFDGMTRGNLLHFYLLEKNNENSPIIGDIYISDITELCVMSCCLGYKIDKDYQSKGLMKEALTAVIDFIYNELMLHKVNAYIMETNIASIELIKRLGFVLDGISRDYLNLNGRWEDHQIYSLINGQK